MGSILYIRFLCGSLFSKSENLIKLARLSVYSTNVKENIGWIRFCDGVAVTQKKYFKDKLLFDINTPDAKRKSV